MLEIIEVNKTKLLCSLNSNNTAKIAAHIADQALRFTGL